MRQEIFRVTENIVAIQQKYRVVRDIVQDMDVPDFLWESGYFEDLNSNERKKYIVFRCSDFDMDAYLHEPSAGGNHEILLRYQPDDYLPRPAW